MKGNDTGGSSSSPASSSRRSSNTESSSQEVPGLGADLGKSCSSDDKPKKKTKKKKKKSKKAKCSTTTNGALTHSPTDMNALQAMLRLADSHPNDSIQSLQKEPFTATAEQRDFGRIVLAGMFGPRKGKHCDEHDHDHESPEEEDYDFGRRLGMIASCEDILRQPHFDRTRARPIHHWLRGLLHRILRSETGVRPSKNPIANWRDVMSDLAQFECFDRDGMWRPAGDKDDEEEEEDSDETEQQGIKSFGRPSERLARARRRRGHRHQQQPNGARNVHSHTSSQRAWSAQQKLSSTYVPYDPQRDPLVIAMTAMYPDSSKNVYSDDENEDEDDDSAYKGILPMTCWRAMVLRENDFDGHVRTDKLDAMPTLTANHRECSVLFCTAKAQIVNDRVLEGDLKNGEFGFVRLPGDGRAEEVAASSLHRLDPRVAHGRLCVNACAETHVLRGWHGLGAVYWAANTTRSFTSSRTTSPAPNSSALPSSFGPFSRGGSR